MGSTSGGRSAAERLAPLDPRIKALEDVRRTLGGLSRAREGPLTGLRRTREDGGSWSVSAWSAEYSAESAAWSGQVFSLDEFGSLSVHSNGMKVDRAFTKFNQGQIPFDSSNFCGWNSCPLALRRLRPAPERKGICQFLMPILKAYSRGREFFLFGNKSRGYEPSVGRAGTMVHSSLSRL